MYGSKDKKQLSFYILANQRKDPDGKIVDMVADYIISKGMKCEKRSMNPVVTGKRYIYTNADEVPDDIDYIIVLGGDGTMLQASRDLHHLRKPILGINIGTLGFLADCELEDYKTAIDKIISEDYIVDKRMMLSGKIYRDGELIYQNYALNDIVLTRFDSMHVIDFNVIVNRELLNSYSADGAIFSTATGSTAYALSAGGPIVEPYTNMIMYTPICPHSLNTRSIILDQDDEVIVEITDKKMLDESRVVTFDGESSQHLKVGDKIVITKHPEQAIFLKITKRSFLQIIRQKMMLNL